MRRLFDTVMAVSGGEEDQLETVHGVAVDFGVGVEGITGDHDGGEIRICTSLYRNAA